MTKILMISTDRKILEEGSNVRARMVEYGKLFDGLHIIVFSKKDLVGRSRLSPEKIEISKNTFVYPTNSLSKLFYVTDAGKIGAKIIADKKMTATNSVITTQDPFETGIVGRKLSVKFDIPLHVQIHTDFHSSFFKKSALNNIRVVLSEKTLAQASAVRAVSERIRNSLSAIVRKKTSVLPIFADMQAIRSSKIDTPNDLHKKYPEFEKIILMASRLTKEKNIIGAVEVFSDIVKDFSSDGNGIGLIIIGSGPEESKIRSKIKFLNLEGRVMIEPWVNQTTLISYMKTCDVFLSTSMYEGYGLSMLEAHTAGVTLVATDAGIAPLLVGEDALVLPDDKDALVEALVAVLNGRVKNRPYSYPYDSKETYLEAFKGDIERALI